MAHHDHLLPAPREILGPTSPQSSLLATDQRYLLFPRFHLESGITITNVPVAFKTWGKLDPETKSNALVVCHALTGSADVEDWWGPLLGLNKVFDPSRFFIVCCNVLGSPYGSASSCTSGGGEDWPLKNQEAKSQEKKKWDGQGWWGPEFPATTPRDDVRIHKLVLEYLGVESIAAVVGGSMGGMAVIEWPLCFPTRFPYDASYQTTTPYIRNIVPLATSARHSAWCISWAEAQRQSIYSDPAFKHGYYSLDSPPRNGLSAARMAALLTYRSRDSFESRFGRRVGKALKGGGAAAPISGLPNESEEKKAKSLDEQRRRSLAEDAALAHNEGNKSPKVHGYNGNGYFSPTKEDGPSLEPTATTPPVPEEPHPPSELAPKESLIEAYSPSSVSPQIFSAQSYLRYQGDKFVKRFDANCYIHLTRKMDSHDVAKRRWGWTIDGDRVTKEVGATPQSEDEEDDALERVLSFLSKQWYAFAPNVLVVSIESDGLFAPPEQKLIHALIPGSEFVNVKSPDGHDGFLLEFEQINDKVGHFLRRNLEDVYAGEGAGKKEWGDWSVGQAAPGTTPGAVKESVFGEVEDVTRW